MSDKKKNIIIGAAAGVFFTTIILLPIALNKPKEGKSVEDPKPSPFQTSDVLTSTCPCFDDDDLVQAWNDILGYDTEYTYHFDGESSCTGKDETSISYSLLTDDNYPLAMGYGVGPGYCREFDALHTVTSEEEAHCRSLIEANCNELVIGTIASMLDENAGEEN